MALIQNKKFHLAYEPHKTYEAGIELHGFEVKSVRQKHGSLEGAYVIIRDGEAFLTNAYIPPYQPANAPDEYDPYRRRRLLLSKAEINELAEAEQQKRLTIVPRSIYNAGQHIKVEIVVAKGKKKADRREDIKKKDVQRDIDRDLKERERSFFKNWKLWSENFHTGMIGIDGMPGLVCARQSTNVSSESRPQKLS